MFKWEKIFDLGSRAVCLFFWLGVVFLGGVDSRVIWANIWVTPSDTHGSIVGQVGSGGAVYYYVGPSPVPPPAFMNFFPLDLTATYESDYKKGSWSNLVEWTVQSDLLTLSTTGTQQFVIAIETALRTSPPVYMPIATVNGVPCDPQYDGTATVSGNTSTICQGYQNSGGMGGQNYYTAARYYPQSQRSIRIGFYPADFCFRNNSQNQAWQGCNGVGVGGSVTVPAVGSSVKMALTLSVILMPDGGKSTDLNTGTVQDTMSSAVSISFQQDTPSLQCPSNLNNLYQPGDGQISMDLTGFIAPWSTLAPLCQLWVVGQRTNNFNALPWVSDLNFQTVNTFANAIKAPLGAHQLMSGLVNAVERGDQFYNVSFIAQDCAGVYAPPTPSVADCALSPVYAASIHGFLVENHCFIASATFGSEEVAPVKVLREFRDQFLLSGSLGQQWVAWYYRESPVIAHWIEQHPWARVPVLLWLSPFEMVAWFFLNPFYFLGMEGVIGLLLLGFWMVHQTRVLNEKKRNG